MHELLRQENERHQSPERKRREKSEWRAVGFEASVNERVREQIHAPRSTVVEAERGKVDTQPAGGAPPNLGKGLRRVQQEQDRSSRETMQEVHTTGGNGGAPPPIVQA